ncbi:hypothetical protein [Streptomyces purpurascens]|uniref:hypothetical protein n=1 Tax=Streptomyces purpurascens TaxID=1924 RepID=UPI003C2F3077
MSSTPALGIRNADANSLASRSASGPEHACSLPGQRLLQNQRGAVVAHAVRRETDVVICRLRFRLLRAL